MSKVNELKKLAKEFYKYNFSIYDFCYYLGLTNVKEDINDKDLEILLNKC